MKKYAVIVGGGVGKRMNSDIPKQFMTISRQPLMMHTISAFHNSIEEINIIVVLPENYIDLWKKLCNEYSFNIVHKIVKGGSTRFHSVKNGLKFVEKDSLVAIHDACRPVVRGNIILKSLTLAEKYGNAIPAIPVNESVRKVNGENNSAFNRDILRIVQTPQTFKSNIIKKAYEQEYNQTFTDDATVVEALGEKIHLFEGNIENIKVTTKTDLIVAENFLNKVYF